MFIYNITTNISWKIHDNWLEWMKQEHMPALLKTNCFVRYQLLKMHDQDEADGPTYMAQYFAESKALYNQYIELYAGNLRKEVADKWGDNTISFRSLLEIIE